MDFTLRDVRPEDAPAVLALRSLPQVIRFTNATGEESLSKVQAWLSKLGPLDRVVVAEIGGALVGIAGLHRRGQKQGHSAAIGMSVHDDFAGRGIGRALLTRLLELADAQQLTRVDLEVFADNPRAIALYRACGFVEEGRLRDAFRRGAQSVDALVMARLHPG